jgi:probable addiction module antidote protein
MALETSRWDVVNYLDSTEAIVGYLEAVFEEGDPALIAAALNDVAGAKGLGRNALNAHTDLSEVIKTLKALGLELTAKAA